MIWTNLDIDKYDLFLVDLWGTVHDGRKLYDGIIDTLEEIKTKGKKIYFFSNYAKLSDHTIKLLNELGMPNELYDGVITSGETFLYDLKKGTFANKKVFNIVSDYEIDQFGLDVVNSIEEADLCVLAGNHEGVHLTSFLRLGEAKFKNKPVLCLNPDICTVKGDKLVPETGLLGKYYELIGGEVIYYGKPHKRIYEYALEVSGIANKSKVIAIGDNVDTDIKGAKDFGIDSYLVETGIKKRK